MAISELFIYILSYILLFRLLSANFPNSQHNEKQKELHYFFNNCIFHLGGKTVTIKMRCSRKKAIKKLNISRARVVDLSSLFCAVYLLLLISWIIHTFLPVLCSMFSSHIYLLIIFCNYSIAFIVHEWCHQTHNVLS